MFRKAMLMSASWLLLSFLQGCSGQQNHSPTFFPIGNKEVLTGMTLEFDVKAVDDDGDRLFYSIQNKPEGAVFQDLQNNTASFSWTPIASDAGPDGLYLDYPISFVASDGRSSTSETVIITVKLGGAGSGAPVFITPADHTLDLNRASKIRFNVEVRDADSHEIRLRMVNIIAGAEFDTEEGSKLATFAWTPTDEQAALRPVWSVRVGAYDFESPEVFQDITILIKSSLGKCEGTSPAIEHQVLPDQRGADDYPLSVMATDRESEITAVILYWKRNGSEANNADFTKSLLTPSGSGSWEGSIPNPGLSGDQTATISYYICAVDDDDPNGEECDLQACMPKDDRFNFTAYAPGNWECKDDIFEDNNVPERANEIEFSADGELYYQHLSICPEDSDWYLVTVPENHAVGAVLMFAEANGVLEMDVFADDGATHLGSGEHTEGQVMIVSEDYLPEEMTFYVRVRGTNIQVENSYDMAALIIPDDPCEEDHLEPNDFPDDATPLGEGEYSGLNSCGEQDWYQVALQTGDQLEVLIEFDHDQGDLDLLIFDPAVVGMEWVSYEDAMAYGITETDDEYVKIAYAPVQNSYFIVVQPYERARADYSMTVLVTPTEECLDDNYEPNDSPDQARGIWPVRMDGLEICQDNEDWYMIYMYPGDIMVVDLTFSHAEGDLDLLLYDSGVLGGNQRDHEITGSVTSDDDEHVEYLVEAEGEYYILVSGYQGARNVYSLQVSVR